MKGVIDLRHILDVNAYNAKRSVSSESAENPSITEATYANLQERRGDGACPPNCSNHDHEGQVANQHARDLSDISTLAIPLPVLSMAQRDKLEVLLRSLLWDAEMPTIGKFESITGLEILRTKGLFTVKTSRPENAVETAQYIVQGVKELYEIKELPNKSGKIDDGSLGALVLIGKGLSEDIRNAVQQFIASVGL